MNDYRLFRMRVTAPGFDLPLYEVAIRAIDPEDANAQAKRAFFDSLITMSKWPPPDGYEIKEVT